MSMLIKIPRNSGSLNEIKKTLGLLCSELVREKPFRNLRIVIDVDPV
jgi:hypothetical protein